MRAAGLILIATLTFSVLASVNAPAANDAVDENPFVLEKEPGDNDLTEASDRESLAKEYYYSAVDLHFAGRFHEAIMLYKKAIVLDPEVAAYHADLGEAYRNINNTREAIIELETAVTLDPSLANAYTTLGVIFDRENLPQRSIEYHRQAIRVDPDNHVAYNNLGHAYDSLGLIRAAIMNYKKAIELQPDFAAAYDNLGTDMMRLGQLDEAVDLMKKAIEYATAIDPIGLYYSDLGAACFMKEKYDEAFENLKKAIELEPYNIDVQMNFFYINQQVKTNLINQGRAEEAIGLLLETINFLGDFSPQMGMYYNSLGEAYIETGRNVEALAAFSKALELMPGNELIMVNYNRALELSNGKSN